MRALVLTHVAHEGPGTLGAFLRRRGALLETRRLFDGEPLPGSPADFDLVVVMGGPMNVYEDAAHPFLPAETSFVAGAIGLGVPVLGICLGAQIIARAAGAKVYRAPVGEVGWGSVTLTEEGRRDGLFAGVPPEIPVLQWHEDTFDIPRGGTLLATSGPCRNQAFRVERAWGLQFHVEVDGPMLEQWFAGLAQLGEVRERHARERERFDGTAARIYGNLLAMIGRGSP